MRAHQTREKQREATVVETKNQKVPRIYLFPGLHDRKALGTLIPSYPRTLEPLYPRTLIPLYPRTLARLHRRTGLTADDEEHRAI